MSSRGEDSQNIGSPISQYKSLSIREVENGYIVGKRYGKDKIAVGIDEVLEFVKKELNTIEE